MRFASFTAEDVQKLRYESEAGKVDLVKKLHHNFHLDKLTPAEKLIATEILHLLAADISVKIRQNIATKFCDNIDLPYEVAVKLANDLEDIVAIPIIEKSRVLKEADLIRIIAGDKLQRQKAVANRADLSENICAHIISNTNAEIVSTLVENNQSKLSETASEMLIRAYGKDNSIMRLMIQNKKISLEQAHNLLVSVSHDLQKLLIVEYDIPSTVVNNIVHDSKEWVIMNLILSNMDNNDDASLKSVIEKLHAERQLTFSVLIRTLSLGNLSFFEVALAKLAGIDVSVVRKLLWETEGSTGLRSIYTKCQMPESMFNATYRLINIVRDERHQPEKDEIAKIQHRILNRLSYSSIHENVTNMDYLVTIVAYNLKKSNLL